MKTKVEIKHYRSKNVKQRTESWMHYTLVSFFTDGEDHFLIKQIKTCHRTKDTTTMLYDNDLNGSYCYKRVTRKANGDTEIKTFDKKGRIVSHEKTENVVENCIKIKRKTHETFNYISSNKTHVTKVIIEQITHPKTK